MQRDTTRDTNPAELCGLLSLDKPTGLTSRDIVDLVARPLRKWKVKAGHAGTLDPLASGVLVVCVGPATRLIEYVQRSPKTYRTVVRLGARSDTLDADGRVEETPDARDPGLAAVRTAVVAQVGTILQRPPAYSALKVGGRRAYDLARAGEAVDLAPRPVTIDRVDVLSYAWPRLELEIGCGGGTYVRSIARDVGDSLGCGGLVEVLVRTAIGPFTLADAVDPRSLTAETIPGLLRPALDALSALPVVAVDAAGVADLARGRSAAASVDGPGEVAVVGPDGRLVAVAEADPATGRVSPRRVLVGI